MRGGDVPDFLNFARKEVVSETTQLKVCIDLGVVVGVGGGRYVERLVGVVVVVGREGWRRSS